MQQSPLNPFPMSDDEAKKEPASAPVQPPTPTITPPATPPQQSVFVQPAPDVKSLAPSKGLLGKIEMGIVSLYSFPPIQMPEFARDMFSRFLPWLTLMACFILVPLVFTGISMGGFLGFITSFYERNTNVFYWATILLLIAQLVLMGIAIPKLLREQRLGWKLVFIATLVSVVTIIMNIFAQFVPALLGMVVGIVTIAVVFYVLVQTRPYYTE